VSVRTRGEDLMEGMHDSDPEEAVGMALLQQRLQRLPVILQKAPNPPQPSGSFRSRHIQSQSNPGLVGNPIMVQVEVAEINGQSSVLRRGAGVRFKP